MLTNHKQLYLLNILICKGNVYSFVLFTHWNHQYLSQPSLVYIVAFSLNASAFLFAHMYIQSHVLNSNHISVMITSSALYQHFLLALSHVVRTPQITDVRCNTCSTHNLYHDNYSHTCDLPLYGGYSTWGFQL